MKRTVYVIVILSVFSARSDTDVKLPDYFTPCMPKSDTCFKHALEVLQPQFKRGFPEFHLDTIEPLHLPDYEHTGSVPSRMNYTMIFERVRYDGASDFKILKAHADVEDLKLELVVVFPKIVFSALETVSGYWNGTEMAGKGDLKVVFDNLTIGFLLDGSTYSRGDAVHLEWKEDIISISYDHTKSRFGTLFEGHQLMQAILDEADEHPEAFAPEIQLLIKNTLAYPILVFLNIAHVIFPVDVLYVLN